MLFAVFGGRKMSLIWVQKIRPSRIFPGKAVLNNSSSIQGIELEDIRFRILNCDSLQSLHKYAFKGSRTSTSIFL